MKQPKRNDLLQSFVKFPIKSYKGLLFGLWHPGVKGGGREARARTHLRKRKTLGSWGERGAKSEKLAHLRLRQVLVWLHFVAQLCPTLCNPMDYSLPGSSVREILQARILKPCLPPGELPNPGLNPGLLHCRLTLYRPSHQASKLGTYFKCRVITRKSRFLWYGMIITVAISAVACSSEIFEMCLKLFYLFYFSIRKWKKVKSLSHVQLFVTPWTVAY